MEILTYTRGDHIPIRAAADNFDAATGKAFFTLKRWLSDPDSAAIVRKTTGGGGITIESGKFVCDLTYADTKDLPDELLDSELAWDIRYRDGSNRPTTVRKGRLILVAEITRDPMG